MVKEHVRARRCTPEMSARAMKESARAMQKKARWRRRPVVASGRSRASPRDDTASESIARPLAARPRDPRRAHHGIAASLSA